jgi:hypothetical protein
MHKLAQLASPSEERYAEVRNLVLMLTNKFSDCCEPSQPSQALPCGSPTRNESVDCVVVESQKVLSPLTVKCKGKPPTKRKVSPVENAVKKSKKNKESTKYHKAQTK